MKFHVNAIFALQTRQGLVFGCAREIDGDHLVFQVPGSVAAGEILDWRMQLVGRAEGVSGALRVETQRPGPPGEHALFDGRIIAMTEQNRALMQSWLTERSGSSSREGVDASRFAARRPPPRLGSTVRKGGRFQVRSAAGGPAPAEPGGTGSGRPADPLGGREAITAAIKQSLSRTMRAPVPQQRPVSSPAPRPDQPLRLEPLPRLEPAPRENPQPRAPSPPAPPPAEARHTLSRGHDPVFGIKVGSRPLQILVRYRSEGAFRRDHEQHLRGSGLLLPMNEPPELRVRGTEARVRIELPRGGAVVCKAEVVATLPGSTGLMLHLNSEQHATLASAAARG